MHDEKSIERKTESPSLRKNFDSFTNSHKLMDAKEEFAQAVYRYRAAEIANTKNLIFLKREMEFLDRKVQSYRYCTYTGIPIKGDYVEEPESHALDRCPAPAWIRLKSA